MSISSPLYGLHLSLTYTYIRIALQRQLKSLLPVFRPHPTTPAFRSQCFLLDLGISWIDLSRPLFLHYAQEDLHDGFCSPPLLYGVKEERREVRGRTQVTGLNGLRFATPPTAESTNTIPRLLPLSTFQLLTRSPICLYRTVLSRFGSVIQRRLSLEILSTDSGEVTRFLPFPYLVVLTSDVSTSLHSTRPLFPRRH